MSRLSPSVLVIILVVSSLLIYLGPGNTSSLTGGILLTLIGIGLVLAFLGGTTAQQREASRRMLGTLTGIVAVACAALLGQFALGSNIGLICAPVLLVAVYGGFLALLSRSGLNVEEGELLLIQRRMDHQHVIRPPGLHSPMMPALEVGIAVMPTYIIETDVEVEMVDTNFLHKVDRICIDTEARIIQHFPQEGEQIPVEMRYEGFLKLPYNYPNRDHVFKELAEKRNQPVSEARMNADFWIAAIQLQIGHDLEQELRMIIHNHVFYNPSRGEYGKLGPTEISSRRDEISALLHQRIQEKVQGWGVEMLEVMITKVELHPERIKYFYLDAIHKKEYEEAERKAKLEAFRTREMAKAEAFRQEKLAETDLEIQRKRATLDNESSLNMMQTWLDALIADNPDMKPDDLKHLLMHALDEHEKRKTYRDRLSSSDE